MKRKKITGLTLTLAAAVVSTALGGALAANPVKASAEAKSKLLTDVFGYKDATIDKDASNVTSFAMIDGGKVYLKRDTAFKWYTAKDTPEYLNVGFKLTDTKYESVSISVDSPSAWATEDDQTTNVITFEKANGGFTVYVNKSNETGAANTPAATFSGEYLNKEIFVALNETGCADGEFNVTVSVDGTALTMSADESKFTNVGAYYAEYSSDKTYPLQFSAEVADDPATDNADSTVVLLTNINGQKFDNITEDKKVVDTAAPVLVVNEVVDGFLLGTAFSLDYDYCDVVSTDITPTRQYYQYNPTHTEVKYNELSTSVYFYETAYELSGGTETTVYSEEGREFVSIKISLNDGTFSEESGDYAKKSYDLSWYANGDAVVKAPNGAEGYIVLDYNKEGPTYKQITLNDTDLKNEQTAQYDLEVGAYQTKINEAAADVYAGSNSYLKLSSLDKLIGDNNGYRSLKFTISYKSPSSSSASTLSNRSYNALEIPVASEGWYEFKVFAVDKAGNKMEYYLDGKKVELDASNVWKIDEIPSFTFEVKNRNLKAEDPTSSSGRKDTEVLGKSYSLDDIKIVGASKLKESYALYKIDKDALADAGISTTALYSVSYAQIAKAVETRWSEVENGDYFAFYIKIYAELLAGNDATLATTVKNCFERIGEQGDRINNQDDRYEKYEWNPTSQSFATVEKGEYLILADFWEEEIPTQRAAAYKLVVVENEVDEIEGTDDWWENNLLSVILFSVAGLMLIIIVILLLIKPSDETLEDVDAEAVAKTEKKKKKRKNKKD